MVPDGGCESIGVIALPSEAQPMLLVLVPGPFCDPAAVAHGSDHAIFLARSVQHALILGAVDLPLGVCGVVAGLRSGKVQVWADEFTVSFEYLNAHPICGLPSVKCIFASPVRQTDQHGGDLLLQSMQAPKTWVMRECKWYVFMVKISVH